MNIDLSLLEYLNKLDAGSEFWRHIFNLFGQNPLVRGGPVFCSLIYVCFANSSSRQKSRLTAEFIGVFVALVLSVTAQTYFHFHLRPIFDSSLNIVNISNWTMGAVGTRTYSMPSDTATAFFGLGVIVFLEKRSLGVLCLFWSLFTVGICRVAYGVHYPSDIVGGLILGGALVYAFSRFYALQHVIEKVILKFDPHFIGFNIALFMFCAEAYSLFPGVQPMLHILFKIVTGKSFNWL